MVWRDYIVWRDAVSCHVQSNANIYQTLHSLSTVHHAFSFEKASSPGQRRHPSQRNFNKNRPIDQQATIISRYILRCCAFLTTAQLAIAHTVAPSPVCSMARAWSPLSEIVQPTALDRANMCSFLLDLGRKTIYNCRYL